MEPTNKITPNLQLLMDSMNLQDVYLDYANNYLTIDKFASDYLLTVRQAKIILDAGKQLNNL